MKYCCVLLLMLVFTLSSNLNSQDNASDDLVCEVHRIYPPISWSKEKLHQAETIADLNPYYKPSWVKEYIAIRIEAYHNGSLKKAIGEGEILTLSQKAIMRGADVGTDISVVVDYIPDNNLKINEAKQIDFTFTIDPENMAQYEGGDEALNLYLQEQVMDKIPEGVFIDYILAIVKFTISEDGDAIDAHVFESSKNEIIDKLLLDAICNMPEWLPAEYDSGTKVRQEFALTVGNMENCMLNLVNIHRYRQ